MCLINKTPPPMAFTPPSMNITRFSKILLGGFMQAVDSNQKSFYDLDYGQVRFYFSMKLMDIYYVAWKHKFQSLISLDTGDQGGHKYIVIGLVQNFVSQNKICTFTSTCSCVVLSTSFQKFKLCTYTCRQKGQRFQLCHHLAVFLLG